MNRIRWSVLTAIYLILGVTPLGESRQVWANAPQQSALTSAQVQAVNAAVSIFLNEEDEYQVFLPIVVR